MNWQDSLLEGLLELARTVVLSIIPIFMTGINTQTGEIRINFEVVIAIALVSLLKALDKFLHEWEGYKGKGMLPF